MRVYLFYLCDKEITPNKFPGVRADTIVSKAHYDYTLYAFTPEKSIAKQFKSTRDMKKFYTRTMEFTRDDYDDFCDQYSQYILEYHTVRTKEIYDGEIKLSSMELLMTLGESDIILYYSTEELLSIIEDSDYGRMFVPLIENCLLNKDFMDVLDEYYDFTNLIGTAIIPVDDNFGEDIDLNLYIDQLVLYIKIFKNTYKRKDDKK